MLLFSTLLRSRCFIKHEGLFRVLMPCWLIHIMLRPTLQMVIETSSSKHEALRMKSECRDIGKKVAYGQHTDQVSIRRVPECDHTSALTLHSCGQDAPIVVELKAVRIHSVHISISTIGQPVQNLASAQIPQENRRIPRCQCEDIARHINGKGK